MALLEFLSLHSPLYLRFHSPLYLRFHVMDRVPISGRLTHCVLHNNSAVDPWVWPATTPVEGVAELNTLDAIRQYLLYAKLPLGYGGALFSDNGGIYVEGVGTVMTSNSALYGRCRLYLSCRALSVASCLP